MSTPPPSVGPPGPQLSSSALLPCLFSFPLAQPGHTKGDVGCRRHPANPAPISLLLGAGLQPLTLGQGHPAPRATADVTPGNDGLQATVTCQGHQWAQHLPRSKLNPGSQGMGKAGKLSFPQQPHPSPAPGCQYQWSGPQRPVWRLVSYQSRVWKGFSTGCSEVWNSESLQRVTLGLKVFLALPPCPVFSPLAFSLKQLFRCPEHQKH